MRSCVATMLTHYAADTYPLDPVAAKPTVTVRRTVARRVLYLLLLSGFYATKTAHLVAPQDRGRRLSDVVIAAIRLCYWSWQSFMPSGRSSTTEK